MSIPLFFLVKHKWVVYIPTEPIPVIGYPMHPMHQEIMMETAVFPWQPTPGAVFSMYVCLYVNIIVLAFFFVVLFVNLST